MRRISLLAPLFLLLAGGAHAEDEAIDCGNIRNTVESNFCADKSLTAADAKLNDVYKKVLAQIATSDLEKPYDRHSWEQAIRESQRAWISFRDLDCKGAMPMEWSGGTGTTAAVLICMKDKTEARTRDLAERYGIDGSQ